MLKARYGVYIMWPLRSSPPKKNEEISRKTVGSMIHIYYWFLRHGASDGTQIMSIGSGQEPSRTGSTKNLKRWRYLPLNHIFKLLFPVTRGTNQQIRSPGDDLTSLKQEMSKYIQKFGFHYLNIFFLLICLMAYQNVPVYDYDPRRWS